MRGFILQPDYRLEKGRAVVRLYGILENGESFLVIDRRCPAYFYVEARDAARVESLGVGVVRTVDRSTMEGSRVATVELRSPSETPFFRARLSKLGIRTYESDVRFTTRYLIDRGIQSSLEIEGDCRSEAGLGRVFVDPRIRPARWEPTLRTLSIDIETDPSASRLLSIALYGCGTAETLLVDKSGRAVEGESATFATEKDALIAFQRRVRELDPDILTGWNVIDFDFRVLAERASEAGFSLEIGRGPGRLRLRPARLRWASHEAQVPGRLILDGIHLLRSSFVRMDDYSLDSVARRVLGEGKTLHGDHRADEIQSLHRDDLARLAEYNLTDARLVLEILEKLKLIELGVERSLLTGLPIDRVGGSIASFDFLYMTQLRKRGFVAPNVGGVQQGANPGGHVLEPEPGLHRNVLVFDFKSLYPSLIRTFQIDPLGFAPKPEARDDVIVAPNGACFRRQPGILPAMLDELFPRREAAKRSGDKVASHAIKILMNSFYGVLGTSACRFHRPELAGAITTFGREILLWSKNRLEELGYRVIYGDTDSLFVLSCQEDPQEAQAVGASLAQRVNRDLAAHVEKTWRVESRLELQFERLYRRLHLPAMRRRESGARKRYVGLTGDGPGAKLAFVGMEAIRRDWTDLAKQVQRELYRRLFAEEKLGEYLARTVGDVRAGKADPLLVYRKGLRKELDSYTATTPPHVAAARKLSHRPGRVIAYVMTVNGPEPLDEQVSPIDREHYVQKQIRPIAEPVLKLVGLDFGKAIGDDRQLELF